MAPVSDLPDRVIEETFMGGLFPWIKAKVEFCRPTGLAEMMLLAQLTENREKIRNEASLKGHNGGKYPFYPSSISKPNNSVSDKGNTTFPMRTITLKSNPIGETKKEGTSKRLSEAEFQARKEKGLCFRCNEKYSHDHKCKNKEQRELRMYVMKSEDEKFEIIEEANYEEKELKMTSIAEEDQVVIELSINSVVGLSNPGSGAAIKGKGICESVEIILNGWKVIVDLLPLELGGVDVVLGMQWLYSLGNTEVDWRNLTMIFLHQGKKILIKGDPSLTKARVSLKNMMKSWEESDQGFLIEFRSMEGEKKLPPQRDIEHHIHLKQGTNPVNVRPYQYAHQQKIEMEKRVEEMLKSGIICPSNSPYSSPVLLVRKKDESWRFCVDYRALNNVTIPDKFPIPVIEELFDELNGATWFSKIDLKAGYHQIRMSSKDIEKTAFRTHEGHYEFMVMPFGLTNAPSTFQSLMNSIFKSYLRKFVLVFFDDILIYSKDVESHLQHLGLALQVLRKNELYANQKKCSFAKTKVDYLGHIISGKGVEVDPEKIRAIKEWPTPKNVREVRGFLGLTGYYRKFVQHYSSIAAPLTQLLKLGGFKWNKDAEEAFLKLQNAMMTLPILALPDFNAIFEVETDASGYGVGAVLMQSKRPIAYFSHTLAIRDRAKPVYERELMAPQYQKWIAKLLGYSFEVVYKPGLENKAADALSRTPPTVQLYSLIAPTLIDLTRIKEEVEKDEQLQKIVAELKEEDESKGNKFSIQQGMLKYKDRLVISKTSTLLPTILHTYHDSIFGGHSGFLRTYKRLAGELYWEGMKQDVKRYWSPSNGFETNFVVVDRFSKYGHFLMMKHPYTVKSVADLFTKEIVRLHGYPKSIVSDRDKIFLSHFWKELFKMAGTKLHRSTAYHPQSDGQTEVVNRGIETYLRCFCGERPKQWVKWLHWAEYWYNTTFQRSLEITPFQAVYGRLPPPLAYFGDWDTPSTALDEQLKERDITLEALKEHLKFAQEKMKRSAYQKRRDVEYEVGDMVFLKIRPYRQVSLRKRRNEKLAPKFFGPYKIIEKIGPVAYKLELPASSSIHPVFHVSQLKKLKGEHQVEVAERPYVTENHEWQEIPEEICGYQKNKVAGWDVLVKWKGLSRKETTWEDYDEIQQRYPELHLEDK
ncbi:Ty3/gypsy retrotransposon protein [Cucumis melo var. makuwa]|uniref:Ty3/gypsy retrotransposon protein n=1 Tax=Cucumis melo var. makuwa TaxID=1194695 RepID=A0A5D3CRH2_CUCMM|nr:Ty3/gypsy retrotransposon protein [Cucumis melo var. makuwa]